MNGGSLSGISASPFCASFLESGIVFVLSPDRSGLGSALRGTVTILG